MNEHTMLDNQLLKDYHHTLLGFLYETSYILYHSLKKHNAIDENLLSVFYKNTFYMQMHNPALLVCADETTRLMMRATQDFLYGMKETLCQSCACNTIEHDQQNNMVMMIMQKYAQRMVTLADLMQFQKSLPPETQEIFIDGLTEVVQGQRNLNEFYTLVNAHPAIESGTRIYAFIFGHYISVIRLCGEQQATHTSSFL